MRIVKKYEITVRSAIVTSFILACGLSAICLMGEVFSVVEQNAFGNKVAAFEILDNKRFSIFGQEVYFPIIAAFEKISHLIKEYAPGIIKLLGFAVNGAEELIEFSVYSILSSLK